MGGGGWEGQASQIDIQDCPWVGILNIQRFNYQRKSYSRGRGREFDIGFPKNVNFPGAAPPLTWGLTLIGAY